MLRGLRRRPAILFVESLMEYRPETTESALFEEGAWMRCRNAELAIDAGSGQLAAEQVLVEVAFGIALGERQVVDHIDNGNQEARLRPWTTGNWWASATHRPGLQLSGNTTCCP